MCGPVYRPPAGAATGAQYGLLGPHEQSHQRERLLCLSVSLYLGHAWQEQKSREGGDFFVEKYYLPGTEPKCSEANETRRLGGGDFRNGKILPDLYFCDGQAIMSMKLTEGST